MDLPELPTDNLYKFIALFGVIISVTSGYFITTLIRSVSTRTDSLSRTFAELSAEAKNVGYRPKASAGASVPSSDPPATDDATRRRNGRRAKRLLVRLAAIESDFAAFDRIMPLQIAAVRTCVLMTCIGAIVSVVGFTLWYYKLQRFDDLELEARHAKFMDSAILSPTASTAQPSQE